jgi:UDP-glucuronate 4-epimerase
MKHALITGGAGFIGSHLVDRLLADGWLVTAIDNFDPFYPRAAKERNLSAALSNPQFRLCLADIRHMGSLRSSLTDCYDVVFHLAAKAGVRPSIEQPAEYQETNVSGTQNILEFARLHGIPRMIFASSSSVYGINPAVPWSEEDHVLLPISPYAATKVAGELLCHVYKELYGMSIVALRFFTVYGPRQRPDLAIHKMANLLLTGAALPMYGDGSSRRDYTYVGDIVDGIVAASDYNSSSYEVINLSNSRTVSLANLVESLESAFGVEARRTYLPPAPGDVPQTWGSIDKAGRLLGYSPKVTLGAGLAAFRDWLLSVRDKADRSSYAATA